MTNVRHHHDSRTMRPALLAVSTLVAAAALGGAAGPAAAHGTPGHKAASHQGRHEAGLGIARLDDGLLTVEGTNADDRIALRIQPGNPAILQVDLGDDGSGEVSIPRAEVERLSLEGGNGDDSLRIDESNGVFTDTIPTTIDGGNGNDRIVGGAGAITLQGGNGDDVLIGGSGGETLIGGNGDDTIDGNKGNDVALMGNGNDTFVWDPGDGSDTVEGQNGTDTMLFNGADASERVALSANGGRLRFFRDPGAVTMDTDDVEVVEFKAFGGADSVTVEDLAATDVRDVKIDLAGAGGGGDGQADRVVVNGTDGNDRIDVSGDASAVKVSGLAATVELLQPEGNDRLDVNTFAGTDAVDTRGLELGAVQLFVDGSPLPKD
jgi:hemolysin type calcium-binding protein